MAREHARRRAQGAKEGLVDAVDEALPQPLRAVPGTRRHLCLGGGQHVVRLAAAVAEIVRPHRHADRPAELRALRALIRADGVLGPPFGPARRTPLAYGRADAADRSRVVWHFVERNAGADARYALRGVGRCVLVQRPVLGTGDRHAFEQCGCGRSCHRQRHRQPAWRRIDGECLDG